MVYRNNAGRLGAGFISVCLETRWLGQMCRDATVDRVLTGLKKDTDSLNARANVTNLLL